jgi:hypothetical protein
MIPSFIKVVYSRSGHYVTGTQNRLHVVSNEVNEFERVLFSVMAASRLKLELEVSFRNQPSASGTVWDVFQFVTQA